MHKYKPLARGPAPQAAPSASRAPRRKRADPPPSRAPRPRPRLGTWELQLGVSCLAPHSRSLASVSHSARPSPAAHRASPGVLRFESLSGCTANMCYRQFMLRVRRLVRSARQRMKTHRTGHDLVHRHAAEMCFSLGQSQRVDLVHDDRVLHAWCSRHGRMRQGYGQGEGCCEAGAGSRVRMARENHQGQAHRRQLCRAGHAQFCFPKATIPVCLLRPCAQSLPSSNQCKVVSLMTVMFE